MSCRRRRGAAAERDRTADAPMRRSRLVTMECARSGAPPGLAVRADCSDRTRRSAVPSVPVPAA